MGVAAFIYVQDDLFKCNVLKFRTLEAPMKISCPGCNQNMTGPKSNMGTRVAPAQSAGIRSIDGLLPP